MKSLGWVKKFPRTKAWAIQLESGRLTTLVAPTRRELKQSAGNGEIVVRVEIRRIR